MSLLENESFKRILTRFKKLFFILLLLPILLAGLGYFIEMNQETTSKATAEIMLGDYGDTKYTEVGAVQTWLKSKRYLKKLKEDYDLSYNTEELAGKTNPTLKPGKVIELSYSTNNKEKAEKVLNELVDAFIKESNKNYEKEKSSLEQTIQVIKSSSSEDEVFKEDTLYKRQSELEKLKPTQINSEVSVDETKNNPIRRAILGFLIGTMFSISILLAPEVFRK
jgi:teichuronic acid biosynthesis protein TuaF